MDYFSSKRRGHGGQRSERIPNTPPGKSQQQVLPEECTRHSERNIVSTEGEDVARHAQPFTRVTLKHFRPEHSPRGDPAHRLRGVLELREERGGDGELVAPGEPEDLALVPEGRAHHESDSQALPP